MVGGFFKVFFSSEFAGDRSPHHARNRGIEKWTGARLFCLVANLQLPNCTSINILIFYTLRQGRQDAQPTLLRIKQHATVEQRHALPRRSIVPMAASTLSNNEEHI